MSVQGFLGGGDFMQTTMGNNFSLTNNTNNRTSFIRFFKWAFNSSADPSLYLVPIKGSDDLGTINFEVTTIEYNGTTPNYFETHNADSLSIMWYLASFGALVIFFLLISFSEVCCKKSFASVPESVEVAPPPYDLFAPPTYDSLYEKKEKSVSKKKKKRRKCEVFVIPMFGDKTSSRVEPLDAPHGNPRSSSHVASPLPLP